VPEGLRNLHNEELLRCTANKLSLEYGIKNETREEYGAQGGEGKCIQSFDGEL
jgi:hypothetical protein